MKQTKSFLCCLIFFLFAQAFWTRFRLIWRRPSTFTKFTTQMTNPVKFFLPGSVSANFNRLELEMARIGKRRPGACHFLLNVHNVFLTNVSEIEKFPKLHMNSGIAELKSAAVMTSWITSHVLFQFLAKRMYTFVNVDYNFAYKSPLLPLDKNWLWKLNISGYFQLWIFSTYWKSSPYYATSKEIISKQFYKKSR